MKMKIEWYSYCTNSGITADGKEIESSNAKDILRKVVETLSDNDSLEILTDIIRDFGETSDINDEPCDRCGHWEQTCIMEIEDDK